MDSEYEYDSAQLKMGCRPAGILIHPPLTLFSSSLPLGLLLLGFLPFPSEPSPCLAGRNMPSFPSHLHCATTLALEILLVVLLIRLLVGFINSDGFQRENLFLISEGKSHLLVVFLWVFLVCF